MNPPVVVGVDGSKESTAAVALATKTAARRHHPLRVVHAFIWPLFKVPLGPSPYGPPEGGLRHDAEEILQQAVAYAQECDPGVEVTSELVTGGASGVLVAESRHASTLVVGNRGLGGFASLLVGSVAVQVASHAECPVVVARGTDRATGPVVVGVDGSPTSNKAVAYAAEEARLRETDLLAIQAWTCPVTSRKGDLRSPAYDPERAGAEASGLLDEATAGLSESHPGVRVDLRTVRDRPAPTLIAWSRSAQLVVVGARGRGGFTGLLLGSVSQELLHHAECPVAIVRPIEE